MEGGDANGEALRPAGVDSESVDIDPSNNGTATSRVSLDILLLVKSAQNAYGLKHGDYRRYRQYCARRLHRLRKALSIPNGRKRFQKKMPTLEQYGKDARFLLLLVIQAERAWAFAMELKNAMEVTIRMKRHASTRMMKASRWAREVEMVVASVGDERTALEAQAYAAWMSGNSSFVRENWMGALQSFRVAKRIYDGMARGLDGDEAAIFHDRADEIEPSIRFCEYNSRGAVTGLSGSEPLRSSPKGLTMGHASPDQDLLTAQLESALSDRKKAKLEDYGSISWCGRSVLLRSFRVHDAISILNARDEEFSLEVKDLDAEERARLYDKLFIAYNDAIRVVQKEADDLRGETAVRVEEREKELSLILAYLTHGRLNHTIKRNLLLVQDLDARNGRAGDFVRLFDTLLQNAAEILELQGVSKDSEVFVTTTSHIATFKARRCRHLAIAHMEVCQYREAAALFRRAEARLKDAMSLNMDPSSDRFLGEMANECRALRCRCVSYQHSDLSTVSSQLSRKLNLTSESNDMTLLGNLDEFLARERIVQIPPSYAPVPCKPILFDVAWESIGFPEMTVSEPDTTMESAAELTPAPSGLLGWLSRRR